MNTVHYRGNLEHTFSLARGSGLPSDYACFYISTEGASLTSSIELGGSQSQLEYCLGTPITSSTWGAITFQVGTTISTQLVSVRAKPTNLQTTQLGSVNILDASFNYKIKIDLSPKMLVLYGANGSETQTTLNTFTASCHPSNLEYWNSYENSTTNPTIKLQLINYDLLGISPSNPISFKVNAPFELALSYNTLPSNYTDFAQEYEIQAVSSSSVSFNLALRTQRNKAPNQPYNWRVDLLNNGSTLEIARGCLTITGGQILLGVQEGLGKPSQLTGVVGEPCNPTSFRVVCRRVDTSHGLNIAAPNGFLISLSPDGTGLSQNINIDFSSGSLVLNTIVYVYLDPAVYGLNLSGNITCSFTGSTQAGKAQETTIPILGSNSAAKVYPYVRTKSLTTENSPNPNVGFSLYSRSLDTNNYTTLSGFNPSYSYSGSQFVYEPDPPFTTINQPIYTTAPIDLTSWSPTLPTTNGSYAVKISWSQFTDSSTNVTYSGGEVISYYTILPGSTSSSVYFGVDKYFEYVETNALPFDFPHSQPATTCKNINGTTISPAATIVYKGTRADGTNYISFSYPTYPGEYLARAYLNAIGTFEDYDNQSSSSPIPHNLVNGQAIVSIVCDDPFTNSTFNYNPNSIASVVEVIDPQTFRIKQATSSVYLQFYEESKFTIIFRNGNSTITKTIHGSSYNNLNLNNQSLVSPDTNQISILKKDIVVCFSPDCVYPSNKINSSSLKAYGLLSTDLNNISIDWHDENSKQLKKQNGEIAGNPNDKDPTDYYIASVILSATGSSNSNLNKYNIPTLAYSNNAQIYRKPAVVTRPYLSANSSYNISTIYSKQNFYKYQGNLAVSGLELNANVILEHTLIAFNTNINGESPKIGNQAFTYFGNPQILISGQDSMFYLIMLSNYSPAKLQIAKKTVSFQPSLSQPLTKIYDGEPTITKLNIPLSGVIDGDLVNVVSLTLNSYLVGSNKTIIAAEMIGQDSVNYSINVNTGWALAPTISILPKPISLDLSATKSYDGRQNAKIPLRTDISGVETRLPREPLCFSPFAPVYNNANAGTSKTSTAILNLIGGLAGNYSLSFVGSGYSGSVVPNGIENPVLGVVNAVSITLEANSISGTKVYDGTLDAKANVVFSINGVQGTDNILKTDLDYTATLDSPNRGLRSCFVTVNGIKSTSQYYGNYIINANAYGVLEVSPKPITSSEAIQWLVLDGVPKSQALIYKNETPSLSFEITETPKNLTPYTTQFVSEGNQIQNPKDAGTYSIRLYFTGWSLSNSTSNYKPDNSQPNGYVEIPFTILKRKVKVFNVVASPTTYDSFEWPLANISFAISNDLNESPSGITVSATYSSTNGVYVPSSSISLIYTIPNENYELDSSSQIEAQGQVLPKELEILSPIDPNSKTKLYDGTTSAVLSWVDIPNGTSPNLLGIVQQDAGQVSILPSSLTNTAYLTKDVGPEREIACNFVLTGLKSANYKLANDRIFGTITPKLISFTGIKGVNKTFDGNPNASILLDGFRYIGLLEDDENIATTPLGNLSAYFSDFSSGTNKTIFLRGLTPPSSNYYLDYRNQQSLEVEMPPASQPYQIYKRLLTIKPKDISKFYGEILPTTVFNLKPTEFIIQGLVTENYYNAINPDSGKRYGDSIATIKRVLTDGFQRNSPVAIYNNVSFAKDPDFEPDRGLISNYDIQTGEGSGDTSLRGALVVQSAYLQNLPKNIKEAIWEKICQSYSCKDLNWFDVVQASSRYITVTDFNSTLIPGDCLSYDESGVCVTPGLPEALIGQRIELQQSTQEDPEVLITET